MLDFRENPAEPLSVSQLTRRIKSLLENNFSAVTVVGEITGCSRTASGHLYFSLKDLNAKIDAVLWKTAALRLTYLPVNGEQVIATGKINVYEPRGGYQIIAQSLRPVGAGAERAALLALLEKLRAEGLFAEERKKELPAYPLVFGLVTSATGAAARDMIKVIRQRFPPAKIILSPCLVQGATAAADIVRALRLLDNAQICEVILLGRGGGSAEDLAAFNDESVARAVSVCRTPIISSVGHEIDTTICDLVADVRAATPSAAAAIAAPEQSQLNAQLRALTENLTSALEKIIEQWQQKISGRKRDLEKLHPAALLRTRQQQIDELTDRLHSTITQLVEHQQQRLAMQTARLQNLDPRAVLRRGFSITRASNGDILTSIKSARIGDNLQIILADGALSASTTAIVKSENVVP